MRALGGRKWTLACLLRGASWQDVVGWGGRWWLTGGRELGQGWEWLRPRKPPGVMFIETFPKRALVSRLPPGGAGVGKG